MRTLVFTLAVCLFVPAYGSEPEFQIDAVASLQSLQDVLRQVRKIESRPILSITQAKKSKADSKVPAIGELNNPNDADSLIVDAGYVHGPESGVGMRFYFRRVKGRWLLTKSETWVL
jgi:predicted ATP-grasp superfamily ATP-dependent carboligase